MQRLLIMKNVKYEKTVKLQLLCIVSLLHYQFNFHFSSWWKHLIILQWCTTYRNICLGINHPHVGPCSLKVIKFRNPDQKMEVADILRHSKHNFSHKCISCLLSVVLFCVISFWKYYREVHNGSQMQKNYIYLFVTTIHCMTCSETQTQLFVT